MSEQAIETDDETTFTLDEEILEETPEETEIEAQAEEESDEIEIVVEGEVEPSSEPVRKSGFYKRLSKLTGQRDQAKSEAEEERLRREAIEEENKLLKMKLNQGAPSKRPKAEDFDSDADYEAALEKYDEQRLTAIAEKQLMEKLESARGQTTQAQQKSHFEGNLREHYAQAEKLKIKDFEAAEDQVAETIGNELLQYIVNYHGEKSAAMVYHLSRNPVKAQELFDLSQDPSQAVRLAQRLTRLEDSLTIRPKHSPKDPETEIDKGVSTPGTLVGARFE